ncbi:hypothetical protein OAD26_00485 [bacterium]|nr:hypothetical protein [bacterium]
MMSIERDFAVVQDFLLRRHIFLVDVEEESWDKFKLLQLFDSAIGLYPPWIFSKAIQAYFSTIKFLLVSCFIYVLLAHSTDSYTALYAAYLTVSAIIVWFTSFIVLGFLILKNPTGKPIALFSGIESSEAPDGVLHDELAVELQQKFPSISTQVVDIGGGKLQTYAISKTWVIVID